MYQQITQLKELIQTDQFKNKQKQIGQLIQNIISQTIQGDIEMFELFMEQNILHRLFHILSKSEQIPSLVSEVYESVASLIINIKDPFRKNYILSHQIIADMIDWQTPFKNITNHEIVSVYIGFLNTIVQKMDKETSMFFINIKSPQFPLLWNTIRFYNYSDLLVRNMTRSIVLNLMRVDSEHVQAYLKSYPFIIYYRDLGNQLIFQFKKVDDSIKNIGWEGQGKKWSIIHDQIQELVEIVSYIHDLASQAQYYQLILQNCLMKCFQLLSNIFKGSKILSEQFAIQMIHIFLDQFKDIKEIKYILFGTILNQQQQVEIVDIKDWIYSNYLDQDKQFLSKITREVYDQVKPIDLKKLVNTNFEIRQTIEELQRLQGQQIDRVKIIDDGLKFLNQYIKNDYQTTNMIYLIYELLVEDVKDYSLFSNNIQEIFDSQEHPLVTYLTILRIIEQTKNIETIKYIYQINQSEIKKLMEQVTLTYEQYETIFKKDLVIPSKEFVYYQFARNYKNDIYYGILKTMELMLESRVLFSKHRLFKSLENYNQIFIDINDIQCQQFQIGSFQKETESIKCQFSQTGHFYNPDICYLTKTNNFLHIVSINKSQITDVIFSCLYYQLKIENIERAPTICIAMINNQKAWIKFYYELDKQYVLCEYEQSQQNFSLYYKKMILQKLC
ncbi:hypothetical protein pb186bvf_010336 [Paramecium bursaria]